MKWICASFNNKNYSSNRYITYMQLMETLTGKSVQLCFHYEVINLNLLTGNQGQKTKNRKCHTGACMSLPFHVQSGSTMLK